MPRSARRSPNICRRSARTRHLRLLWQDEPRPLTAPAEKEGAGRAAFLALMRAENHGIHRTEQLDGNIGYLDVRWITDAGEGAHAIGAAMELVARTRALLLDLRQCRGGSPAGAAMWCSYFFPDDEVHLNDIYERSTDSTRQYWTLPYVPAPASRSRRCTARQRGRLGGQAVRTPCRPTGAPRWSVRRREAVRTPAPSIR